MSVAFDNNDDYFIARFNGTLDLNDENSNRENQQTRYTTTIEEVNDEDEIISMSASSSRFHHAGTGDNGPLLTEINDPLVGSNVRSTTTTTTTASTTRDSRHERIFDDGKHFKVTFFNFTKITICI